MHLSTKRKIALGVAVLAAAGLAGGAYAATQGSNTSTRQAFLNDLANRLHVTPQQLTSAIQGAFFDQLDAAVKAGRLTQAQANAIKQRVQRNGLPPLFGLHGFGHPGVFGGPRGGALDAAASYLGLSRAQLFDQVRSGKSLAQIARSRGKSVTGLEQAMTSAIRSKLDRAVAAGRITKTQEQQILSRLSDRLSHEINMAPPRLGSRRFFGPPRGFPAPPDRQAGPPADYPGGPAGPPPAGDPAPAGPAY